MKLSKKQLEKLQELDAILDIYKLSLRLVSFDDTLFMLQLHKINSLDPRTYNISSIQLVHNYDIQYIKNYTSVRECINNLLILKDLFIYNKLSPSFDSLGDKNILVQSLN